MLFRQKTDLEPSLSKILYSSMKDCHPFRQFFQGLRPQRIAGHGQACPHKGNQFSTIPFDMLINHFIIGIAVHNFRKSNGCHNSISPCLHPCFSHFTPSPRSPQGLTKKKAEGHSHRPSAFCFISSSASSQRSPAPEWPERGTLPPWCGRTPSERPAAHW